MNTKLLISLIIVIALIISISITVNNFNNQLQKIEKRKLATQALDDAEQSIRETDQLLKQYEK